MEDAKPGRAGLFLSWLPLGGQPDPNRHEKQDRGFLDVLLLS
jgi:hypothetical protein